MLLAIDTSAGTAVAVVADDGRVLAERSTGDTRRHAEVIGPFLDEVLHAPGVSAAALTGVVTGIGPGPYTGLRVGIAAARAVAFARGIPLLPVPSHDAVALASDDSGLAVVSTLRADQSIQASLINAGILAHPGTSTTA